MNPTHDELVAQLNAAKAVLENMIQEHDESWHALAAEYEPEWGTEETYEPEQTEYEQQEPEEPVTPVSCEHFTAAQPMFDQFPILLTSQGYRFDRPNDHPSCSDKVMNSKGQFACSYAIGTQHECPRYGMEHEENILTKRNDETKTEIRVIRQRHGIGVPVYIVTKTIENEYGMMTMPLIDYDASHTDVEDALHQALGYAGASADLDGATTDVAQVKSVPVSYLAKLVS